MPSESHPEDQSSSGSSRSAGAGARKTLSADRLTQAFAALAGRRGRADADGPPAGGASRGMEAESSQKPESGPVQEGPQSGLEFPVSPAGILEAVLFVGRPDNRPFSTGELVELMNGVRSAEIDGLVEELNLRYRRDGSPYEVVARASGYEMVLRDEVRDVQDRFFGRTREARLSTAAIEVLSVVAYNQPLPASQVNAIRGKPSASLLAQLVRRRLLTLDRPPEGEPGSPQYRTTDRFLQLLGLESLADLPPLNDDENGL